MDSFLGLKIQALVGGAVGAIVAVFLLAAVKRIFKKEPPAFAWRVIVLAAAISLSIQMSKQSSPSDDEMYRRAGARAEEKVNEMLSEAKASNAASPSEAFSEAANRHVTNLLSQAGDDQAARRRAAMGVFQGFYWTNTRVRPEYCAALGVKIDGFIKEFEEANRAEISALKADKSMPESARERLFVEVMPSSKKLVETQMSNWATEYKVTPLELCDGLERNAREAAEGFRFSVVLPQHAAALFATGQ